MEQSASKIEPIVPPTKKWFYSKTLWINAIAAAALFAQTQYGFIVSPQMQLAALAGINILLRAITKQGLEL